jgi:hypothetical protein
MKAQRKTPKPETHLVHVLLPKDLYSLIQKQAALEAETSASIIRRSLRKELEKKA